MVKQKSTLPKFILRILHYQYYHADLILIDSEVPKFINLKMGQNCTSR